MDYFTRFLIEKSLSMDNVFVIALNFHVLCHSQTLPAPCAFFWGILGVIALRAIMIALGATLVSQFSWVRYIFGIFLVFTGIKMWVIADHVPDIGNNPILQLLKWHLRVTEGFRGNANAQPNQRLSWAGVTFSQVKVNINQQLTLEFLLPLHHQQATQTRVVKGLGCDRHGSLPSFLPSEAQIFCWRGRWSDS